MTPLTKQELRAVVELLDNTIQDLLPGENDENRDLLVAAETKLSEGLKHR